MTQGVLCDVRVLQLSCSHAVSAAGAMLYQAGAQVWLLEPAQGGAARGGTLFSVLDRGKSSVALDLSFPSEELERLLASADVLLHGLTQADAARMGMDDAALASRQPRLVVSAVRGWPLKHPLADRPARETLVLARLGLLDEQPGHRPGPVFIRMPFASWVAGWLSAIGVLARLIARDRDGRGGVAHTSLAQAGLAPMSMHWARAERPTPVFAKGLDKAAPIPLHRCADGRWIHVHYSPDKAPWMAEALEAMGPEEVAAENARFAPSHVAPNFGANRQIIAGRSAQDWVEHFWAHDVSAQVAVPFGEIYRDAQARANGYVVQVPDPELGPTLQPGAAWHAHPPARVGDGLHAIGIDTERVLKTAEPRGGEPLAGRVAPSLAQLPPLHGLKVLDHGAYLAGPFACMLLADLGADVIKVEPPAGDAMRRLERAFAGAQRGKRGLALKLGTPAAQPVLEALVRWADVVHHNVRMPAARKLGIDPETLRAVNPALVHAHISSYGPEGARAGWPGFDQLMQAACGWEVECGGEGNSPMWLRFGVGDHLASLASVFAVLVALLDRRRTGQGQAVASSLLGAVTMTVAEAVGLPDGSFTPMAHLDAAQTGLADDHRLYRCRDGWIAVAALEAGERAAFRRVAGADAQGLFGRLDVDTAVRRLSDSGVPAEPVLQDQAVPFLDDADHAAAGLHAHYPHPVYGRMQQVGALWDFGDLPLQLHRAPPALGQHSREVLAQVGLSESEIEVMKDQGVTTW